MLANSPAAALPTRAEIGARARAMFARTPSSTTSSTGPIGLVLDAISARLRAVPG